ncbi:MAG TPA: DedA family protein [Abditibacteriaceae bacterium]|nr:DedA family protein [Abditibacteriaceae bacterium]
MFEWITNFMNSAGYFGVLFLMFLENVFPPIPSELVMPLAGYTAKRGSLSLLGVIVAGTLGSVLGSLPLYFAGKLVGEERIKNWADKYGVWFTVSREDIEKSKAWFERHGNKAVLLCRLVPGVRSLISLPAGISQMNLLQFLLYSAIGSGAWTAALAYLGFRLGENYKQVERFMGPATYVVLGLVVLMFVVRVVKQKKAQKT